MRSAYFQHDKKGLCDSDRLLSESHEILNKYRLASYIYTGALVKCVYVDCGLQRGHYNNNCFIVLTYRKNIYRYVVSHDHI